MNKNTGIFSSQKNGLTKQEQIVNLILSGIEKGEFLQNSRLPSINEYCKQLEVSRDTVILAYRNLEERGIVIARHGKGYFVSSMDFLRNLKVFALFDVMNSYKEILYRNLIEGLGRKCTVDMFFHYYNLPLFEKLIKENVNNYGYFIIMPHFNTDVSAIVKLIPPERLLIIDKEIPALSDRSASIFQNFESDVFNALTSGLKRIRKYNTFKIIVNHEFQFVPKGCIDGYKRFCKKYKINGSLVESIKPDEVNSSDLYMVFSDSDLIELIKIAAQKKLKLGTELGIISYDDTPLKEVLKGGITVISTDFSYMGKKAAEMILTRASERIENPSALIVRNTL